MELGACHSDQHNRGLRSFFAVTAADSSSFIWGCHILWMLIPNSLGSLDGKFWGGGDEVDAAMNTWYIKTCIYKYMHINIATSAHA